MYDKNSAHPDIKRQLNSTFAGMKFGDPRNSTHLSRYLNQIKACSAGTLTEEATFEILLYMLTGEPYNFVESLQQSQEPLAQVWIQLQLSYSADSNSEGVLERIKSLLRKRPNNANHVIANLVSLIQLKNSGFPMADRQTVSNLEIKNYIFSFLQLWYSTFYATIQQKYLDIISNARRAGITPQSNSVILNSLVAEIIGSAPANAAAIAKQQIGSAAINCAEIAQPGDDLINEVSENTGMMMKETPSISAIQGGDTPYPRYYPQSHRMEGNYQPPGPNNAYRTQGNQYQQSQAPMTNQTRRPYDDQRFDARPNQSFGSVPRPSRPFDSRPHKTNGNMRRTTIPVPADFYGKCLKCKQEGHWAQTCPIYKSSQLSSQRCLYCDAFHSEKCRNTEQNRAVNQLETESSFHPNHPNSGYSRVSNQHYHENDDYPNQ